MSGFRALPRHLRVDAPSVISAQLTLFGSHGRTFAPYQQWEDYRAGMFKGRTSDAVVTEAARVLRTQRECHAAMLNVVQSWPVASAVNLTNSGLNRRAWMGQAACCLAVGATAHETKRAWWQLTEPERVRANQCADEVIALWHTQRQ